ncbi:tetratricopeptide repeat protein [Maridesulfovibrio bastinii]|uniref:tetratricopeptide repeat protein n=1 Tax=Maridesulfovibrio bastinii TaxID=47157 RepID=UPI00042632FC|nr:tetratricopeptide repeat protein [Maridesulfovibrio bastinii]
MADEKKSRRLSRRGFLFGGLRKLKERENPNTVSKPIAARELDLELLAEGNVAYENGRYAEAAEKYKTFVRIEPENSDARKRLGHCLYLEGKYIQARVELSRALKILGKDNFSSLYLGLCFCRMGRGSDAVASWKGYFNPNKIEIQREVNLQLAMIETDPETDLAVCADMVEKALSDCSPA